MHHPGWQEQYYGAVSVDAGVRGDRPGSMGFFVTEKSIQKRVPRQEKTSRKCENVGRLSPQGGDLVQMRNV